MYLSNRFYTAVCFVLLLVLPLVVSGSASIGRHAIIPAVVTDSTAANVFIRAVPEKSKIFVGEPVMISFLLYHAIPVIDPQHELMVKFEDAFVEEYTSAGRAPEESINGRRYQVVPLKKYLVIPQREGKFKIPAVSKTFKVTVPPAPDDFFGVEQIVEKKFISALKLIEVMPLPQQTDSVLFSKAIGEFKFSGAYEVSSESSAMVTYKLKVAGIGNMKSASLFLPELPAGITVFNEEKESKHTVTEKGLQVAQTFSFQLVAGYRGSYTIPAITFLYFNPKRGEYERYVSEAYEWVVKDGPDKPVKNTVLSDNGSDGKPADLIIKKNFGSNSGKLFLGSATFYMLLVVASLLFLISYTYTWQSGKRAANPGYYLSKQAVRQAVKSIKVLMLKSKQLTQDEFYKTLCELVERYFCNKFYLTQSALSQHDLEKQLYLNDVPVHLQIEVTGLLKSIYANRFSPSGAQTENRAGICRQSIELIKTLEPYLNGKTDHKSAVAA